MKVALFCTHSQKWMAAMENQKHVYLSQTETVENLFCRSFFVIVLQNTWADACEFFGELPLGSNFMRRQAKRLDADHCRRYFVLMGMYYLLFSEHQSVMAQYAARLYGWTETEKELFAALSGIRTDWQRDRAFGRVFQAYVLEEPKNDVYGQAFFAYYLSHSRGCMKESLKRYGPVATKEGWQYGKPMDNGANGRHNRAGEQPAYSGSGRQRENCCSC